MNANLFNRKTLLSGALIALAFGLNAQVKSTHTDEKYANTTIVYKDKAATDQDVLNALGAEYGMGDVIRVAVAPPKPPAAPAIDKSKGEDVWLNTATKPEVKNLSASYNVAPPALSAPEINLIPKAKAPSPKAPAPIAVQEVAETQTAAAPAISTTETKTAKVKSTSTKAGKSYKKPGKKSGKGYGKAKHRKHKQRYGCPTF